MIRNRAKLAEHSPTEYTGPLSFEELIRELGQLSAEDVKLNQPVEAVFRETETDGNIIAYYSRVAHRSHKPGYLTTGNFTFTEYPRMRTLVLYRNILLPVRPVKVLRPFVASLAENGSIYLPRVEFQDPKTLENARQIGFLSLNQLQPN